MTDIVSCDAMKVDMRLLCKQLGSYTRVRILAMNQMEVVFENGNLLQSYDTVVAARVNGKLYFSLAYDYSRTTSKYVTQWSGVDTKKRRKMLDSGEAFVIEL